MCGHQSCPALSTYAGALEAEHGRDQPARVGRLARDGLAGRGLGGLWSFWSFEFTQDGYQVGIPLLQGEETDS